MKAKEYRAYAGHVWETFLSGVKWILFGAFSGCVVGAVGAEFSNAIVYATALRQQQPRLLFFLPLAGIGIVAYYHLLGVRQPRGTNLVLEAIRDGYHLPGRMAPLIILSTVLTHLFGGSAGREGAALQVGGSLGELLGKLLHFKEKDRRTIVMCGMSAAFSALFGTPLAAAVLSMEISTVGILYYSALVPCVISALTAKHVAEMLGAGEAALTLGSVPSFQPGSAGLTLLFAVLCAVVSALFCTVMHRSRHLLNRLLPNPYLRALSCGLLVVLLTLLVGDQSYNGAGARILERCITEPGFRIVWYAFLMKMLFTAITLSGGFQGGEIVPSLFIGATLGNAAAFACGLPPALFSAIGMTCVFCGVTNCPITALLISFEMFGFHASSYFLLAVAVTYLFSGNYGLYSAQKILHSKVNAERINANAH